MIDEVPFTELLSKIVDNRGRTCPTSDAGLPLIATNCVRNELLYPAFDKVRYVSKETYANWFRGHPEPGDLIFVCKGTPGRVCVTPDPVSFCIAQDMVAVRADPDKVYPKYLFALLRSTTVQARIANMHVGTLIPHFKKGDFDKLLLPVPGKKKQETIGDTYFELSAKIELNQRMNATLEAMARALFQNWFVDFAPSKAKAAGSNDPLHALFPDTFQDSPHGPIPHGWEITRLDDIASVMMGLSPDGNSYNADGVGIPLINGPVEFGDYFPVKTKWTEAGTRFADEGDLVFCVRGSTTGRRVVSDGVYGIGRGVCAIRAKGGYHSFLYQTINVGLDRLLEKTTGSVFPSLSSPDIKGFSVLKPSKGVLDAYERTTKPLIQRIQQNHHQSRTLATLRDTLLPKLLSGEVSVGDNLKSQA
jgi:type I restriction enzyme S subunit